MNSPRSKKERQRELFDEFQDAAPLESDRMISHSKKVPLLSLSFERTLICSVLIILCFLGAYILGYYKGKSTQYAEISPKTTISTEKEAARPTVKSNPKRAYVPQAKSVAKDPGKPYTIQFGAFRNPNLALKNAKKLKSKGYDPRVISQNGLYFVCAGEYSSRNEAGSDLRQIRIFLKDAFIRKN